MSETETKETAIDKKLGDFDDTYQKLLAKNKKSTDDTENIIRLKNEIQTAQAVSKYYEDLKNFLDEVLNDIQSAPKQKVIPSTEKSIYSYLSRLNKEYFQNDKIYNDSMMTYYTTYSTYDIGKKFTKGQQKRVVEQYKHNKTIDDQEQQIWAKLEQQLGDERDEHLKLGQGFKSKKKRKERHFHNENNLSYKVGRQYYQIPVLYK